MGYRHFSEIDHFTVVCLDAWPLNETEARVDLVYIKTSLLSSCKFVLISMRTASLTQENHGGSYQTPASLSFKGQATKLTTVKINGLFDKTQNAIVLAVYQGVHRVLLALSVRLPVTA